MDSGIERLNNSTMPFSWGTHFWDVVFLEINSLKDDSEKNEHISLAKYSGWDRTIVSILLEVLDLEKIDSAEQINSFSIFFVSLFD